MYLDFLNGTKESFIVPIKAIFYQKKDEIRTMTKWHARPQNDTEDHLNILKAPHNKKSLHKAIYKLLKASKSL